MKQTDFPSAGALANPVQELAQLEAIRGSQQQRSWPGDLEARFRSTQRHNHRHWRTLLFLVHAAWFGGAPWYGRDLFSPSGALSHWFAPGLSAAGVLMLTTAALTWFMVDRRLTKILQVICVFVAGLGAVTLRYFAVKHELNFPQQMFSTVIVSLLLFGGYAWKRMAIGAAACFSLTIIVELRFNPDGARAGVQALGVSLMAFFAIAHVYMQEQIARRSWVDHRYADTLARIDVLTGLWTRNQFNLTFERRVAQARREGRRIAVLMLDIDHFKQVNDGYGHLFGDEVLRAVGGVIVGGFAQGLLDMRVRYGGEEMVIFWYGIDERAVGGLAESLLTAIRSLDLVAPATRQRVSITASIGVTTVVPDQATHPEGLLRKADELLYRAKARGRNRVVIEPYWDTAQAGAASPLMGSAPAQTEPPSTPREVLAYHRKHDPLTGVLNRGEFLRHLRLAPAGIGTQGSAPLLCYADIDHFNVINDALGYEAGDELLRRLAQLFESRLRPGDLLARIGGDAFGFLIGSADLADRRGFVESLLETVREFRFVWESQPHAITISIGAAELARTSGIATLAFVDAESACTEAKLAGRDRARWYQDCEASIRRRKGDMAMVARMTRALDEDQFLLYYEDVFATAEAQGPGRVRYRELLVRMRGDDGQLVLPAQFITAVERYHLMAALDRWVIGAAFKRIARLPDDGVLYALNVSGMSLSDDQFLKQVIHLFEVSRVLPKRICFEITETSAITHLSEARRFIDHLTGLGCHFALDDFGVGMASFSYLKTLPVQFIKIDGSFVRGMRDSTADRRFVEAINLIGHEMGLCTIAEHVEDAQTLEMLLEIGVDWVQGHAVAVGRPFDELLQAAGA